MNSELKWAKENSTRCHCWPLNQFVKERGEKQEKSQLHKVRLPSA